MPQKNHRPPTIDYQIPQPNRPLSKLALATMILGCIFLIPIQLGIINLAPHSAEKQVIFGPSVTIIAMSLLAILRLRQSQKRGLGFAVAGFCLGVAGLLVVAVINSIVESGLG